MNLDLDKVANITETTVTIRGPRRRTTVPAEIARLLGLENGDRLRWIAMKDKSILIFKVED